MTKFLQKIIFYTLIFSAVGFTGFMAYRSFTNQASIVRANSDVLYKTKRTPFESNFGTKKDPTKVVFKINEKVLTFKLPYENIEWRKTGNKLIANVGEKKSLSYSILKNNSGGPVGIKEEIILNSKPKSNIFEFSINLEGLTAKKKGGLWNFYDKNNNSLFYIPKPYMVDANGDRNEDIDINIDNGKLVVNASQSWLNSDKRKYPIKIDPSFELTVLTVHSKPVAGEIWDVEFTTAGKSDLKISPNDQQTVDDMDFVKLTCDGKEKKPRVLKDDVIYYPNWECNGTGEIQHKITKQGNHELKFEFGDKVDYAHNASWLSGWENRIELTIDNTNIDSDLTHFPIPIFLNSSAGQNGSDVTPIFDEIGSDWQKIAVTKGDGTSQIYVEKESWLESNSETKDIYLGETSGTGGTVYRTFSPINFTGLTKENGTLLIDLKASDWDSNTCDSVDCQLEIGSDGIYDSEEWHYNFQGDENITSTYQTFEFDLSDFVTQGGELDVSAINWVRWYAQNAGTIYWKNARIRKGTLDEPDEAVLWVSKDDLTLSSSSTTDLYLYYDSTQSNNTTYVADVGSRTEVWDDNFIGVWHKGDLTTSTVKDSTSNDYDGTKANVYEPVEVNGKLGEAQDYDGTNDQISTNLNTDVNNFFAESGNPFTVTAWSKGSHGLICGAAGGIGSSTTFALYMDNGDLGARFRGDSSDTIKTNVSTTNFIYAGITWDGSNTQGYYNGSAEGTPTVGGVSNQEYDFHIGTCMPSVDNFDRFDGIIDEVRVSSSARSDDWIKANYYAQTDNLLTLTANSAPNSPTSLEAEGQTNPTDIHNDTPGFTAIYSDTDSSDVANKYQIQVDNDSDFSSPVWDSGSSGTAMSDCSEGTRCSEISYGGSSLTRGTTYYWRIKFWDDSGNEGSWSTETATFSIITKQLHFDGVNLDGFNF